VWPDREPPQDGSLAELKLDPDTLELPTIEINSGAFLTVQMSEKEYFPAGFPW
jgi:hypothetical protein